MPPRSSVSVLTNYLWFMKWDNDRTIQRAVICQSTRIISTCTLHLIYRTFFAFFINNISHNWSHLSSSLSGKNATVNRNIASASLAVAASCSKKHDFNLTTGKDEGEGNQFCNISFFKVPIERGGGKGLFTRLYWKRVIAQYWGWTPCTR